MKAYGRLTTCRTANGALPWTAVDAYAQRHGITGRAFRTFEDMIYGLEVAMQERSKAMAEMKKRDRGGKEGRPRYDA